MLTGLCLIRTPKRTNIVSCRRVLGLCSELLSSSSLPKTASSPRTASSLSAPLSSPTRTYYTTSNIPMATPYVSEADRYLFDLNGYLVIKNVFTPEEVAAANAVITSHMPSAQERTDDAVRNTKRGTPLAGDGKSGRIDLGGVLGWRAPGSELFRSVLDHPSLVPYFHDFLGKGYRMDHMPFVIAQNKGSEGFSLHGGTIDVSSGEYNHYLAYSCMHGVIRNSLLACSVVLSDHPAGSGGFAVVRGSHKSNFKAPTGMIDGLQHEEFVYQPVTSAGDVVLFSEGTVHGARPWTMDWQRRVCLYRFAPSTNCYGRSYLEEGTVGLGVGWPKEIYADDGLTDTQKAVLLPPYANRLDRLVLKDDVREGTEVQSRSKEKKAFDKTVFGTEYF